MKKLVYFLFRTFVLFLISGIPALAGDVSNSTILLNHPKDIVYDQERHCFYITNNAGNNVVTMDSTGNLTLLVDSIPGPMGLALFNDTLIISSSSPATITAIKVTTGEILYQLPVPEATYLSHMDADPRTDQVYIIEQEGGIIRLDYRIPLYSFFVPLNSGLAYGSQTLEVDTANNQVVVFQWNNGYIKAVSLSDSTQITNLCLQGISQVHASERIPTGEIYVTRYYNNGIYRYNPDLSVDPELIASVACKPAGLTYNPEDHSLYVCNYGCNAIEVVPLIPAKTNEHWESSFRGVVFPNPATLKSSIEFSLSEPMVVSLVITDIQGRELKKSSHSLQTGDHSIELPVKNLFPGTYFITLKEKKNIICSEKLVKL